MINDKLIKIQNTIKVNKTQYNSFGKFYYRNAEDIYDAVKPIASGLGAVITLDDDLVERGGRVFVKATATIEDVTDKEDRKSVNAYAELPTEKKGMDQSQITGAASSYARKYALGGLLLLDDNKDADYAPPQETPKAKAQDFPQATYTRPQGAANDATQGVLLGHTGGAPLYICEDCGSIITPYDAPDGKHYTVEDLVNNSKKAYGKQLCVNCIKKVAKNG